MLKRPLLVIVALLLSTLLPLRPAPAGSADERWDRLDAVAEEAVKAGNVPGVVLLVSHRDRVVYRKAFGSRAVEPERVPMTVDTVFDLASLTKGTATGSSIMALVEEGKLRLNDPVVRYWPEFGQNGKEKVTLRQLLTHSSGLASWRNFQRDFGDPSGAPIQEHTDKVLAALAGMPLANPSDTRFVYSDLGYITLGEIVRRVSGEREDQYVKRRIFDPLKMRDTGYNPDERLCERAAPTEK